MVGWAHSTRPGSPHLAAPPAVKAPVGWSRFGHGFGYDHQCSSCEPPPSIKGTPAAAFGPMTGSFTILKEIDGISPDTVIESYKRDIVRTLLRKV